jgi:hypothetical protein
MAESIKINPKALGLAGAIVAAIFWTIYSAGAFILLVFEVYISSYHGYTDLSIYEWKPEIARFLVLLFAFGLGAGLTAPLVASLYNFLNEIREPKLR